MKYIYILLFLFLFFNEGLGQSLFPVNYYENRGEIEFCRMDVHNNKLFWPLGKKGLIIFDVSNPNRINRLKLYRTYEIRSYNKMYGSPYAIKLVGDKAYLAHGELGFDILDISNILDPKLIGRYSRNQSVYNFKIYKDYAILGLDKMGLEVVDFSDSKDIQMVSRNNFEGLHVNNIDILEPTVYAACGHYGLKILSFNDPLEEFKRANFPKDFNTQNEAEKLQIYKGIGLLANDARGISVLDLTLKKYPDEIDLIDTEGKANDLIINKETMYVATSNGIEIYSVEDPQNIFRITSYSDKKRKFQKIAVEGKYLYATYKKGWWLWKKYGVMIFEIE